MRHHRTKNVEEAVALAKTFKAQGTHDWFRGQTSNWPLRSSFVRLAPDKTDEALQKLGRFERWVKRTPGLEALANHIDSMVAVAQHYGLPTNFIDFTTEPDVAGFFASNASASEGMDSCIMCLNTEDLRDFWIHMPAKYQPPEFLLLDVPNLWRLEAQYGTFLFCPYENFEYIYDLDRILFPYTGLISKPTVEQIYPHRKSNLEVLLDQYFMNETLIEGTRIVESMQNVHWLEDRPDKCDPDLIIGGTLPRHDSWEASKLQVWLLPKREKYYEAVTQLNWEIDIPNSEDSSLICEEVSSQVKGRLLSDSEARDKLLSWSFQFLGKPEFESLQNNLARCVRKLWDGLRTLPFADEELAQGVATCVALFLCGFKVVHKSQDPWLDAASMCFGKAIEVEFGSEDGSYSRGYVCQADLIKAVRTDFPKYLTPKYRNAILGNMTGMLQAVHAPDRLFVFDHLAKLFARQIAPSQVLIRPSGAIFFSPARLDSFGLP